MMPLDWQTADHADGPAVVRWLAEREDLSGLDSADRKLVARWRSGSVATFVRLDRLLIGFGRHPSELPESVWMVPHPRMRSAA